MMKILFIQGNLYASGYYRIAHPAEELKNHIYAEVELVSQDDEWRNEDPKQTGWLIKKLKWADIVVFELQTNSVAATIIPIIKKFGKKIVIDYDDNLFGVPMWNPAYFGLGLEFTNWWKGKKGEPMDIKNNKRTQQAMIDSCQEADMITVTGPKIAEVYKKYNSNVRILPNSIDFRQIRPCKKSIDGKIRIFWQGSTTHTRDLELIKDVFKQITEEHDNVQWVIWGTGYDQLKPVFGSIPKGRIEFIETVPFVDYYKKLNSLTIDIGLCPLLNIPYNECKSNIKWLEYSALKVPAVASRVSTYESIEHGETGFLAKRHDKWVNALRRLIESPELRAKIAEKAYNKVKEDFNIEKNVKLWVDTYRTLFV